MGPVRVVYTARLRGDCTQRERIRRVSVNVMFNLNVNLMDLTKCSRLRPNGYMASEGSSRVELPIARKAFDPCDADCVIEGRTAQHPQCDLISFSWPNVNFSNIGQEVDSRNSYQLIKYRPPCRFGSSSSFYKDFRFFLERLALSRNEIEMTYFRTLSYERKDDRSNGSNVSAHPTTLKNSPNHEEYFRNVILSWYDIRDIAAHCMDVTQYWNTVLTGTAPSVRVKYRKREFQLGSKGPREERISFQLNEELNQNCLLKVRLQINGGDSDHQIWLVNVIIPTDPFVTAIEFSAAVAVNKSLNANRQSKTRSLPVRRCFLAFNDYESLASESDLDCTYLHMVKSHGQFVPNQFGATHKHLMPTCYQFACACERVDPNHQKTRQIVSHASHNGAQSE
ncbi:hypothetical protein CLF_106413, partial [Clonorchis sinensis]